MHSETRIVERSGIKALSELKGLVGGAYKPLGKDDIEAIHETSMRVFSEVGIRVKNAEALELFASAGADSFSLKDLSQADLLLESTLKANFSAWLAGDGKRSMAGMFQSLDGDIKDLPRMLTADAIATVFGSILGTSTTTSYIESASGVAEGGRTGMTAVTTGVLFLVAAFFTPLIGSVQAYATAPALIIVGIFMMRGIGQINFYDFEEGVPAFLTLILMPLTYSIAQGLVFGFITYALIKVFVGKIKELDPILMIIAVLCLVSLVI